MKRLIDPALTDIMPVIGPKTLEAGRDDTVNGSIINTNDSQDIVCMMWRRTPSSSETLEGLLN